MPLSPSAAVPRMTTGLAEVADPLAGDEIARVGAPVSLRRRVTTVGALKGNEKEEAQAPVPPVSVKGPWLLTPASRPVAAWIAPAAACPVALVVPEASVEPDTLVSTKFWPGARTPACHSRITVRLQNWRMIPVPRYTADDRL